MNACAQENTLVSVVIPCYQQMHWLGAAIRSVLASTWQQVEIWVIDDGSSEALSEEVLAFLRKGQIHLLHQRNQGVCKARNVAIGRTQGDFVLPLDADDMIAPTYLEKAMTAFRWNRQLAVVSSGYCYLLGKEEGKCQCETFSPAMLLRHNQIVVTSLFRKSLWERVGGFAEILSRLSLEDWDFWLSVYALNPNFLILPEPLIYYRLHGPSRNACGQYIRRKSKLLILLRHWRLYVMHPIDLFYTLCTRWLPKQQVEA